VRTAVDATLTAGVVPADLGGTCSTSEMGDAVLERIAARAA
jgi:isocitrate/isopropylmalate dehydrogenase